MKNIRIDTRTDSKSIRKTIRFNKRFHKYFGLKMLNLQTGNVEVYKYENGKLQLQENKL